MTTTKATKTKKTSPKAGAVKVTEAPDCAASAGCESQTAQDTPAIARKGTSEPVSAPPVYHTDPELLKRLDRIVELLEGTVQVERRGIDFESPAWKRFLKD